MTINVKRYIENIGEIIKEKNFYNKYPPINKKEEKNFRDLKKKFKDILKEICQSK